MLVKWEYKFTLQAYLEPGQKKKNLLAQNITSNKEITSPDWYWYWYWLVDTYNRKCNFPMSPSMSVGRSVDSVGLSVGGLP